MHRATKGDRRMSEVKELVDKQAELDALWLQPAHIETAMVQQALRHLHAVIEGDEDADSLNGYLEQ